MGTQANSVPSVDQIATEIMDAICKRVNVTIPQRRDFEKFIGNKVRPFVDQPSLFAGTVTVDDEQAFAHQSEAILNLLKKRRSQGAFNHELAKICLKYTGRISDLRADGFKITCHRDGQTRTFLYVLAPEHW